MGKTFAGVLVAMVGLMPGGPSWAWGPDGHELVGAIAQEILGTSKAGKEVRSILVSYDLSAATTWADCVKSVKKSGNVFHYVVEPQYPECHKFEPEKDRMADYVRRNWSTCKQHTGQPQPCHTLYHFTDVTIQRDAYSRDYFGTADYDIVHAINNAVAYLREQKVDSKNFSIRDRKEALLMIAHLVGDLHQPLHVGSVYLNGKGNVVDADKLQDNAQEIEDEYGTRGGNYINIAGAKQLHSMWDGIPASWKKIELTQWVKEAKAVSPLTIQVEVMPSRWASDTVLASKRAFKRLSFGNRAGKYWKATADDQGKYKTEHDQLQHDQIIKAGARMAQLLKEIWPD
jgi:hypothetical protein